MVKIPDASTDPPAYNDPSISTGPAFRHVYNRLMGPTFPGEYIPPRSDSESNMGLYILSYPGIAFTFPLKHSSWSPNADFVSLLSSNAALQAKSVAIFNGPSWQEARQDLFLRPSPNPRSLALSSKGKELHPDEIDLVKIWGNGKIELLRRSSLPFTISLSETTPQDLVAELGPPDAIYRKNDRRLSIHKSRPKERRQSYSASPTKYDDIVDTDHSSIHTTTDESDAGDDSALANEKSADLSAECFYNYFHHGFDILISYPTNPSPPFPNSQPENDSVNGARNMDHLVAVKVLIHGNVPGSYSFNRYRRSRWIIESPPHNESGMPLTSETLFSDISASLRLTWRGNYNSESEEKSLERGMVLNRGWGDSPGSSCELLGGWEENTTEQKRGSDNAGTVSGPGFGNTELFGFPGLIFEVLKNDFISCVTIY